jgi:peroxiredoxin
MPDMINKKEVVGFYDNLTTDFKNNIYGKQIKEFISNDTEPYPLLGVGDAPYQFLLPDSANTLITLAEFEGKYVLLDFWASGCGPCRVEHKNYFQNYQKYHSKGFEILSVSQDQSKRLWKRAMEKDKMIWKSVWDEDRLITKMYRIGGIPANFLIGREGKIIAKNLKGEELTGKLAELF